MNISPRRELRLDVGVIATLLGVALAAAVLDRGGFLRAIVMLAALFSVVAAIRMRQSRWRSVALYAAAAAFGLWFLVLLPTNSPRGGDSEQTQQPSATAFGGPLTGTTGPTSPKMTSTTSEVSAKTEEITVEAGTSVYVLDGAVRISVIGVDFGGTPLRHRVDAVVTEVASGASLTISSADVGFNKTFGEQQVYRVVLLSADTFSAQIEVRRLGSADG